MTYYANFDVNNGTRLANCLTDTNWKRLAKTIKEMAKGECFCGSRGTWLVADEDGCEVASGKVRN